jgi:uncharacterized protein YgbK (DUF1537 family)
MVEDTLASIARGLVTLGVGQMIIAGGETSGAVVKALGVRGQGEFALIRKQQRISRLI